MTYQPQLFSEISPHSANSLTQSAMLPRSAHQTQAATSVSKRYGQIKTFEIVDQLGIYGFQVEDSSWNGRSHGKHIVRLKHSAIEISGVGVSPDQELELRFALVNSHDGTTSYRVNLELYNRTSGQRYTISNAWSQIKVRHNIHIAQSAPEATYRLGDQAPRVAALVNTLKVASLGIGALREFAHAAARARWGKRQVIDPELLLTGIQPGTNAFSALTQIQDRLLNDKIQTIKRRLTRPIRSPTERLRIQLELWQEAERLACGDGQD